MSLSNFNQFREGSDEQNELENKFFENWMGMNILVAVFSSMFNIFNTILLSFSFQSDKKNTKNILVSIMFTVNMAFVIVTNFSFEHISTMGILTVTFSIVFTVIVVPSFLWIINAMLSETY
jgi:low temperature requirement protein LtrA